MTDETTFGAVADSLADRLRIAEGALREIVTRSGETTIRRSNGMVAAARLSSIAITALATIEAMEEESAPTRGLFA